MNPNTFIKLSTKLLTIGKSAFLYSLCAKDKLQIDPKSLFI
jgi:hypothetical protein